MNEMKIKKSLEDSSQSGFNFILHCTIAECILKYWKIKIKNLMWKYIEHVFYVF